MSKCFDGVFYECYCIGVKNWPKPEKIPNCFPPFIVVSLSPSLMEKKRLDFTGKFGVTIVGLAVILALFGYVLAPDGSPHANTMHLNLANQSPGFEVSMLQIPLPAPTEVSVFQRLWNGQPKAYSEIPITHFDGQYYHPFSGIGFESAPKKELNLPEGISTLDVEVKPRKFYLGTDRFGRDLLSRLILGTRISLAVGFISVAISLFIGIPLGLWAGYYGGWIDKAIMWLVQVVWSVPTLLLVIALTLALGKGFWQVFVAVGLTMWVEVARMVRGQVLSIRKLDYIEAAEALSYPASRIMRKHILPNVIAPVIVISAANFSSAILIESGLSFLGIGAQPPMPSWGGMIKDHYPYLITGKAYLALAPGICILLLVLAFMLIGNSLRDALDVKQNR
jgi:peptide/nickel transport system permease protein